MLGTKKEFMKLAKEQARRRQEVVKGFKLSPVGGHFVRYNIMFSLPECLVEYLTYNEWQKILIKFEIARKVNDTFLIRNDFKVANVEKEILESEVYKTLIKEDLKLLKL